jgi:hypothetical protein
MVESNQLELHALFTRDKNTEGRLRFPGAAFLLCLSSVEVRPYVPAPRFPNCLLETG